MILWFVLLGITVGLRTMTAMAVLCWFAWFQLLPQNGWAFWVGYLATAVVFTVLAVGEYIGDTLPQTPNRTDPMLVGARLAFGALVGALAAHGTLEPAAGGILFGVLGAVIGTYGGYRVRMYWSKAIGHDLPVALTESAIALLLAIFACWQAHQFIAVYALPTRFSL
ncbi:MAG: DUF4126 domain-containing protein [Acidobacteria bacterium]|nr:DUF4126 domain-containing protein [Acidobacteriota bacterium]